MNVTSMLSRGYLQPFHVKPVEANRDQGLSAQEQQALIRERTLTGPDVQAATTYSYSIGADGRRYVTGAEVSIKGNSQGESVEKPDKHDHHHYGDHHHDEDHHDHETQAAVRELKRIEQEVIAHEAAHQAAGGGLAGAATYTYTKGPDGRSYITGGEVSIRIPVSDDPEQTVRDMELVQRAALAPAAPSAQDVKVAGKAAAIAAQARQEAAANAREERDENVEFSPGISSVKAGILFERLHGEEATTEGFAIPAKAEELPGSSMIDPRKAYEQTASDRGLWTLDRGFEFVHDTRARTRLDIAA